MQRAKEIVESEILTLVIGLALALLGWFSRATIQRVAAWNELRKKLPGRRAKTTADIVKIQDQIHELRLEQQQTRDLVWLVSNRHKKGDEVCVFVYSSLAGNIRVNDSYNALLGVFAVEHNFEFLIAKRRSRDRGYLTAFDSFLQGRDRDFFYPDVTLIPVDGRPPIHVDVEASAIRNEKTKEVIVVGVFRPRTEPPVAEDRRPREPASAAS